MARKSVSITPSGLNNTADPAGLPKGTLTKAENVYLRADKSITVRDGYTAVDETLTAAHSLWSSPVGCFYVSDSTIYRFLEDETSVPVIVLSSNNPVDFLFLNGIITYTSATDNGAIIDGIRYPHTQVTTEAYDNFKEVLPVGQLMAYAAPYIAVASGSSIRIADPYADVVDTRKGWIPLPGYITMLRAVENGFWVGYDKSVAFIPFSGEEFNYRHVADIEVLPGSAVESTYKEIGRKGDGRVVVFETTKGTMVGDASGSLTALNEDDIVHGSIQTTGTIVDQNGETLYIVGVPASGGNRYVGRPIVINNQTIS